MMSLIISIGCTIAFPPKDPTHIPLTASHPVLRSSSAREIRPQLVQIIHSQSHLICILVELT